MAEPKFSPDPEAAVGGVGERIRRYDESLPIALLRAREAVMNRFRPHLAARGLTEQQWRVIRVLAEADKLDATEIGRRCCILTPSLSRIFKALVERGLITRERAGGDARRLDVSLTKEGQALFDEMAPESVEIYRSIEREVGVERLDELLAGLDQIMKALDGGD